jgi:DNA-binding transcriptional LysR family regulator
MLSRPLDLDTVQTFILVADFGSFTRAAEVLQTTQSAVSLKLKRLEERIGSRLLERTPRYVELSAHGSAFLAIARELLEVHERALNVVARARQRLVVGVSDHVAGPELPAMIARMNAQDPQLAIELRIGSSGDLLQSYDRRELEAAIVRFESGRKDGDLIAQEQFTWFAAPNWQQRAGEPLPVATLAEPCGVRVMAGRLLDEHRIPWSESFVGGGVPAVVAAVMAGLGVAALAPRMLPFGAVDVGARLKLPMLPRLPVILHSRVAPGTRAHAALDALCAAFKSAVRG